MSVSRPHKLSILFAALATATFVAAHSAQAFSIDPQSGTNADGSAKFVDPGDEMENWASDNGTLGHGSGFLNFDFRPSFGADQRGPQIPQGYPQYRNMRDH